MASSWGALQACTGTGPGGGSGVLETVRGAPAPHSGTCTLCPSRLMAKWPHPATALPPAHREGMSPVVTVPPPTAHPCCCPRVLAFQVPSAQMSVPKHLWASPCLALIPHLLALGKIQKKTTHTKKKQNKEAAQPAPSSFHFVACLKGKQSPCLQF